MKQHEIIMAFATLFIKNFYSRLPITFIAGLKNGDTVQFTNPGAGLHFDKKEGGKGKYKFINLRINNYKQTTIIVEFANNKKAISSLLNYWATAEEEIEFDTESDILICYFTPKEITETSKKLLKQNLLKINEAENFSKEVNCKQFNCLKTYDAKEQNKEIKRALNWLEKELKYKFN